MRVVSAEHDVAIDQSSLIFSPPFQRNSFSFWTELAEGSPACPPCRSTFVHGLGAASVGPRRPLFPCVDEERFIECVDGLVDVGPQ
jgi:hypothetical protein